MRVNDTVSKIRLTLKGGDSRARVNHATGLELVHSRRVGALFFSVTAFDEACEMKPVEDTILILHYENRNGKNQYTIIIENHESIQFFIHYSFVRPLSFFSRSSETINHLVHYCNLDKSLLSYFSSPKIQCKALAFKRFLRIILPHL